ncbi:MAG: hypothetical protein K2P78_12530 [Gemmataceae bacterium]|nr:hypothetical protein [Gemmataceae bacterium]
MAAVMAAAPWQATVDFGNMPMQSFTVTFTAEATSGARFTSPVMMFSSDATHEQLRDAVSFMSTQNDWDVQKVGQTRLIVRGHNGFPVRKLTFETTNGAKPDIRWTIAPLRKK